MSSALGKLRSFGIDIQPPDINRSSFTFSPSVDENKIYFGLKGMLMPYQTFPFISGVHFGVLTGKP
jgi:hypothetical protein